MTESIFFEFSEITVIFTLSLGLLLPKYPFKSENLEILIPSIDFIISPFFYFWSLIKFGPYS